VSKLFLLRMTILTLWLGMGGQAMSETADAVAVADALRSVPAAEANAYIGLPSRCRADIVSAQTGQLVGVVAENRYLLLKLAQPTSFLVLERQKAAGKITVTLRHIKNVNQTYYVTLQQQGTYASTCSQAATCKSSEALLKLEQEKTEGRYMHRSLIQQVQVRVDDYCASRAADRLFYSMPWYEKLFRNGFPKH
jgi:hypothetical protein